MTAFLIQILCRIASPLYSLLHVSGMASGLLALRGFEKLRWHTGRLGVWIRFHSAQRLVPAYRDFVNAARAARGAVPTPRQWMLPVIPVMDKINYIKAYPLSARCKGGVLPAHGLLIDESSGSSGTPTNWVRGAAERRANGRTIKFGLRKRLGTEPLFFINAFALGPWATGINLTLTLSVWGQIKSLGPDINKIVNTLKEFGTSPHYVIMGYPPFLKQLLDNTTVRWSDYNISLIFGGEGMSESMRQYLRDKGVQRIFGSYGASDLELNMAGETDFTIALRRLLDQRADIARRVLRHGGAMPMIFQYNPADFFIESNDDGELLVTLCRPTYVAPKVRYNIHDVGHVMRMPELLRVLGEFGIHQHDLDAEALDLPVLFHYGRSDLSVSYYGCKIPPADIQDTLFRLPELAIAVDAFQLRTFDDAQGDKRLVVELEVASGALPEGTRHWQSSLFDVLASVNQDFRESRRMVTAGKEATVVFHETGTGPFANADIRVKRQYVDQVYGEGDV